MATISDLKSELEDEIAGIVSSEFDIVVTETNFVPDVDDPAITYQNIDTLEQKCKQIETCVLYVDLRRSMMISLQRRRETLVKLYSSFLRSMMRAAIFFDGKVRNIIGDRVMVMFDAQDCFSNAVNTAILMNSIGNSMFDRLFPKTSVKCGIGIAHGKMLAAKVGVIKHGTENTAHKNLVWVGQPANIASRLTDVANKTKRTTELAVRVGRHYSRLTPPNDWLWSYETISEFLSQMEVHHDYLVGLLGGTGETNTRITHKDKNVYTFHSSSITRSYPKAPPILMTESVYEGFRKAVPNAESVRKRWWRKVETASTGMSSTTYGGSVVFTGFD